MSSPRLAAVFTGLGTALAVAGACGALVVDVSFVPYLLVLAAAPFLWLGHGMARGAFVFVRSGEREHPPPKRMRDGSWKVQPFRPQRVVRDVEAAAAAVFAAAGVAAFGSYLARHGDDPGALAVLLLPAWLVLVARFAWSAVARTVAMGWVEDAVLDVRPKVPVPGQSFTVRVEQRPRGSAAAHAIHGFRIDLVARMTLVKRFTTRYTTGRRHRVRVLRAGRVDLPAAPGADGSATAEHTFDVPLLPERLRFVLWRVEVRSRLAGPDYLTRFFMTE
jgi:hypothetical protein